MALPLRSVLQNKSLKASCAPNIDSHFNGLALGIYTMDGERSAQTQVTIPTINGVNYHKNYTTSQNCMHSEMVALNDILNNNYVQINPQGIINLCLSIRQRYPLRLSNREFNTDQPHCGYCTCILNTLGLPLSTPTKGQHNYASSFIYPLPIMVKSSHIFWSNLIGANILSSILRDSEKNFSQILENHDDWSLFSQWCFERIFNALRR